MSNWWYVIVILALVALGFYYMRYRRNHAGIRDRDPLDSPLPGRDFAQEREADRVGHMTAEDHTWEAASLARNRATEEQHQTPPVHR